MSNMRPWQKSTGCFGIQPGHPNAIIGENNHTPPGHFKLTLLPHLGIIRLLPAHQQCQIGPMYRVPLLSSLSLHSCRKPGGKMRRNIGVCTHVQKNHSGDSQMPTLSPNPAVQHNSTYKPQCCTDKAILLALPHKEETGDGCQIANASEHMSMPEWQLQSHHTM